MRNVYDKYGFATEERKNEIKASVDTKWESIIDEFVLHYRYLADKIIGWYPSGQGEIIIMLKDGTKFRYDSIEKNTYPIYDPDEDNILEDELEWRKMFSNRLCAKMHKFGYNQSLLSEATGISQVTISKYINCKATPTAYNVQKLAKALHCNSFELIEYRVF